MHIWSISSSQAALSCHICLNESDYERAPEIIKSIHSALLEKHGIDHITIQPEGDYCPEQAVQQSIPPNNKESQ
mgnify:CR=1 FL=1